MVLLFCNSGCFVSRDFVHFNAFRFFGMAIAFCFRQNSGLPMTLHSPRAGTMKYYTKMNSEEYVASYFQQDAQEAKLRKSKQFREQLATIGVLTFVVFSVTLATLSADVWIPALQDAFHNWRVLGGGF